MWCYSGVMNSNPLRVVLDTNVIFEGLTKSNSASGLLIDAWREEMLTVFVSTALLYEYQDVLIRKLAPLRWKQISPVLNGLLRHAEYSTVYFTWRPSSPDPGDDHVVDCALNSRAIVVTSNVKDFRQAQVSLGVRVARPVDVVKMLDEMFD